MFARRNTPNYSDPGYLDYKKNVEYCNSFYGGDKIPDRDKTVYEAWQNHEPIGC